MRSAALIPHSEALGLGQARKTEPGEKLRESDFVDDERGKWCRFGNVWPRSIVFAHGEEDAFHIPINVILPFDTRSSAVAL